MATLLDAPALSLTAAVLLLADSVLGGEIRGSVRDALSGAPLDGALVELSGTPHQATSGRGGAFVLASVPSEPRLLRVTLAGYARVEAEARDGEPVDVALELLVARLSEAVTVTAQRGGGWPSSCRSPCRRSRRTSCRTVPCARRRRPLPA